MPTLRRMNGAVRYFRAQSHTPLSKVHEAFAQAIEVSPSTLLLKYQDVCLFPTQTIAEAGILEDAHLQALWEED